MGSDDAEGLVLVPATVEDKLRDTNSMARLAKRSGHDGLWIKNVIEPEFAVSPNDLNDFPGISVVDGWWVVLKFHRSLSANVFPQRSTK